jgi:hypothetical protein
MPAPAATASKPVLSQAAPLEQLRQLGDVGGSAPRIVACEQIGSRAAAGLILNVDVGERLTGVIPHDEAGISFFGGPRRTVACE